MSLSASSFEYDVVIAGAGPVGLFLACELGLAGCSVLVIEQAAAVDAPHKRGQQGLRGLSVASAAMLDQRDLLDELRARAAGAAHLQHGTRRPAGHFAGLPFFFDQVDQAAWLDHLRVENGPFAVELAAIEAVFAKRALALGGTIWRGCAVESFEHFQSGVVVRAGGQTVATRWLVGCDGGRSVVRKQGDFGFAGTEPELTGYSAQIVLEDSNALQAGRRQMPHGMVVFGPPGTLAMAEYDGGIRHRVQDLTHDELADVLSRICGRPIRLASAEQIFTWTDRAFLANRYRDGRVFLAGDAAHIHSPLGGQGLNLGLGDAANLGWKLASVLHGKSRPDLLDSYERERRPIAHGVLDWSRAQIALMRPDPGARALMAVMRDMLATTDGATSAARRVWGMSARYDLGSGHRMAGQRAPDFVFTDGRRLAEILRNGGWWLLDFADQPALRAWCGARVGYACGAVCEDLGLTAALVRPDGVVAWASNETGGVPGDVLF